METEYARRYPDLYRRHWWWRAREEVILSTLKQIRPKESWGEILDVGCGDGLFFEKLERFGHVEGIEMDPTSLTLGGRWSGRIHVGSFDESFQPGKAYALILMLDVLEHFPDALSALKRAVELLEPGGKILITVPAFPILWTSHDDLNQHYQRYTRASLADLVRRSGARIDSGRYFFHWASALKLAVHIREQLLPVSPRPPQVPRRWLNRALYRFCRAEEGIFERFNLPFGSSLLAVVAKI